MIGNTSDETAAVSSSGGEDEEESSSTATPGTSEATSSETTTGAETTSGGSGESGSTGPGDTGMGEMCSNVLSCNAAIVLGTVSGDESSQVLHTNGTEPTWLTFRVTENNDSISGESVSFTATLSSPPGYDFDIYAFRGADGGTTGCGGVMDESTGVGMLDIVSMTWGEGGVANGGDESAWVAVRRADRGQGRHVRSDRRVDARRRGRYVVARASGCYRRTGDQRRPSPTMSAMRRGRQRSMFAT
jgi:hypothetical protein